MKISTQLKNIKMQLANVFATLNKTTGNNNEKINEAFAETSKLNAATENLEEEMAESLLSMVEVINDLNETIEEVSE